MLLDDIGPWLDRLADRSLDFVFEPCCPACDRPIARGHALCPTCSESLYPLGPACPRCAEPLAGPVAIRCRRCQRHPPPFARVVAPYRYGGELASALRRLKDQRRRDIARTLAPLIAPTLAEAAGEVDLALPVPLHRGRMARRGFNQAALLLGWAAPPGLPIDRLSLRRTRATSTQRGLDPRSRARNVAGAFQVLPTRRAAVRGRRILLADDIVTTGATLAAASRALLEAGARSVTGFCVARAELE